MNPIKVKNCRHPSEVRTKVRFPGQRAYVVCRSCSRILFYEAPPVATKKARK